MLAKAFEFLVGFFISRDLFLGDSADAQKSVLVGIGGKPDFGDIVKTAVVCEIVVREARPSKMRIYS